MERRYFVSAIQLIASLYSCNAVAYKYTQEISLINSSPRVSALYFILYRGSISHQRWSRTVRPLYIPQPGSYQSSYPLPAAVVALMELMRSRVAMFLSACTVCWSGLW